MIELPMAIVSTNTVIAPAPSQSFLRSGCAVFSATGSATAPIVMHQLSSLHRPHDEASELSDQKKEAPDIHPGLRLICKQCRYAWKLLPHPQVLVAFGFLNTNPLAITSSLKSISVPLR